MENEQSHYDDSAFDDVVAGPETGTDPIYEPRERSEYRDETYIEDSGHLSRSDEEEFEKFFGGRGNSEARDKVGESSYGSISDADNESEGSDSDEWAAEGLGSNEPDFDMGDDLDFDGTPDEDEGEGETPTDDNEDGEDKGFLNGIRSRAAELVDDDGDDQDTFRSRLADLIEPDEEEAEEYSPSDFDHDYEPADDDAEDEPDEGQPDSTDEVEEDSSFDEEGGDDEGQPVDGGDSDSVTRGEPVSYTVFRGGNDSEEESQRDDETGAENRFSEPWTGDYGDKPYATSRNADSEDDFGVKDNSEDSSASTENGSTQDEATVDEVASSSAKDSDFDGILSGFSDSDDDSGHSPMHEELMREFEQQRAENEHKIAGRTLYFDDDIDADEEDW